MVRASVVAEKAGLRSVSIVASGFVPQARAIAQALGVRDLAIAEYPGVIMTDSPQEFQKKVENLVEQVVEGLATPVKAVARPVEPQPRETIFEGALGDVQEHFHKNLWSDGLPVIPPTLDSVEEFLRCTDRSPDQALGVLAPEKRQATVWNVAVNGVMAGCRPEYMPLLVAIVEAIADPHFRIEDGGSTPGWEPLVILNGPIVKELDFNSGPGVMRVGRQANSSVGRFLRLYMRNVAGLRIPPGATDKGSIGYSFNVALAENEDAVRELGWQPFSADRGFRAGENVVTVQSVVSISPPIYPGGDKAQDLAQTIAEVFGQATCGYWSFTGMAFNHWYPLLVMSPSIAKGIARSGWTKDDLRKYLCENVTMPAGLLEKYAWQAGLTDFSLRKLVEEGVLPREYAQSADPNRPVRVFLRPDWIGIVVAGDPDRNQARGYVNNHAQGVPVSRKIELPARWQQLLQ
ncbi:MAG: hypothetical protein AAB270_03770, partial [Chloroflexota bacterium]